MVKAVLFDLDGTILDTNELIIESFTYTFEKLNRDIPTRNDIILFFGEPLNKTMGRFFENVDEAISIYRGYNLAHHDERIILYKNTEQMLKTLKNMGIEMYIVTSKNMSTAERGLKYFGINEYFKGIVASDTVKNHKPHPEPVLKACKSLNVNPSEAIMVGDSIYDIISGREAGSKTCGVLYSFMKDSILKEKADYYVEDLMEIIDIVKKEG